MTRRRWWVGILMMVGVVGGCGDGDHHHQHRSCLFVGEVEPNDTVLTTQFLDDIFVNDCIVVTGNLFDAADVDRYSVLIQESLTLVLTLDHSSQMDLLSNSLMRIQANLSVILAAGWCRKSVWSPLSCTRVTSPLMSS